MTYNIEHEERISEWADIVALIPLGSDLVGLDQYGRVYSNSVLYHDPKHTRGIIDVASSGKTVYLHSNGDVWRHTLDGEGFEQKGFEAILHLQVAIACYSNYPETYVASISHYGNFYIRDIANGEYKDDIEDRQLFEAFDSVAEEFNRVRSIDGEYLERIKTSRKARERIAIDGHSLIAVRNDGSLFALPYDPDDKDRWRNTQYWSRLVAVLIYRKP